MYNIPPKRRIYMVLFPKILECLIIFHKRLARGNVFFGSK